ncbi:MAG: low affinity iron permease family protein [Parachlamydiales bacterium]
MWQKFSAEISKFLTWSSRMAGNPLTFIIALTILGTWFIIGLMIGIDVTWLLVIDTIATINATLMVFIIQSTQIRENKALHLKIDELIRVTEKAESELIAIEEKEEAELIKIKKRLFMPEH